MSTPTKEDLEARERAYYAADEAVEAVERARRLRKEELAAQADAEFKDRLTAAWDARARAETALDEVRIARSLAGADAPHPPGTRLYEWTYSRYYYGVDPPWTLTGRAGAIEVITPASEFRSVGRYRNPKPGDYVLRILKKDGSPSRVIIPFSPPGELRGWRQRWLPEGEKPKS